VSGPPTRVRRPRYPEVLEQSAGGRGHQLESPHQHVVLVHALLDDEPVAKHVRGDLANVLDRDLVSPVQARVCLGGACEVDDPARAHSELDARKLGLAAQEEVLNAVRAKVRERLAANPNPQALRKLLVRHAAEWKTGRVYCNARDALDVRASVGSNFGGTIDCIGGIVIESGDGSSRLDLTYDSLLNDLWGNIIKEVASRLWPRP